MDGKLTDCNEFVKMSAELGQIVADAAEIRDRLTKERKKKA